MIEKHLIASRSSSLAFELRNLPSWCLCFGLPPCLPWSVSDWRLLLLCYWQDTHSVLQSWMLVRVLCCPLFLLSHWQDRRCLLQICIRICVSCEPLPALLELFDGGGCDRYVSCSAPR